MATAHRSAVIVGGGIGGLAAAITLAQIGVDVRVCERCGGFSEEGAGIQIGPSGSRIIQALGAAQFLKGKVTIPDQLIAYDGASGRELAHFPLGSWITERHGSPYWTAHRHDLHLALRRRAENDPRITLSHTTEIVSYTDEPDGISAIGTKGEVLGASLLVAADGLWSALRSRISASKVSPKPLGKTAFRSITTAENLPAGFMANAVHIWLSPGAHAVHYPVDGGRSCALVVITDHPKSMEGWDLPATADTVREKIKSFAPSLQSLIANADQWQQWSLYHMATLPRWTSGRAALLGDAAHPMLPFLAQGAVIALEDAATLSANISASKENFVHALHEYELCRRPRVTKVVETSHRNGRIYHMNGPAALARNAIMKLRSPERVMASFDWLYSWKLKSR